MIGSVINSAIIYLCEQNVSELHTLPSGEIVTKVPPPRGVRIRTSSKDHTKYWKEDMEAFALMVQQHVLACERCRTEPLGANVLKCFNK